MLSLLNRRNAALLFGVCILTSPPMSAASLPERVEAAVRDRIAAGTYHTLVFGIVEGGKSEVAAFGKLDDGKTPDGDSIYEIGSITKTPRLRCWRSTCLRGA